MSHVPQSYESSVLSAEDIDFFERNGYLLLRNTITPEFLVRLQKASLGWEQQAEQDAAEGIANGDYAFMSDDEGQQYLMRINCIHTKANAISLEILGSPFLQDIARSLCGEDCVTGYESLLIKHPADKNIIPWHQDAVYDRRFRVLTLGIYLDDSTRENGCLMVLPGTQREKQDICALKECYGYHSPEIRRVEAQAGDIIIHDAMVVHSSLPLSRGEKRRTIYFEFRPAQEFIQDNFQNAEWIESRRQLQQLACAYWQSLQLPEEQRQQSNVLEEAQRLSNRTITKPGNFCFEFDVPTMK